MMGKARIKVKPERSKPTWWKLDKTSPNAYRMRLGFSGAGSTRRILLLADVHWDSAHCQWDLLKATLEEAKQEGAPILVAGDFFDAMGGKWDPRASHEALRDIHRGGNYLDLLVNTAADWLRPYAGNLALMSYGNHETSIRKRHEVDLLQRLCHELRGHGSPVECGPYWGFVVMSGVFCPNSKHRETLTLHYHHGFGGGGEITRGLIDQSRTRGQYMADVYFSGHIHRRNQDENIITTVSSRGMVEQRRQLFLRASSWKDESHDGWHVQQGRAARPIGGWWLEMTARKTTQTYILDYRATPTL